MCSLCQLPTTHQQELTFIWGYIDPGSGYVFNSIAPMLLGFLGTLFVSIFLFFKRSFFLIYKKKILFIALLLILILGIIIGIKYMVDKNTMKIPSEKVVVLGIDALDPRLVNLGIDQNQLPNFKKLKESGYYSELATTFPPQSPVAWASFITGSTPQKHNVYDFIYRDPKDYSLNLTFSDNPAHVWPVKTFWDYLSDNKIPSTILFLPDTYPVPKNMTGKILSGMGVPDVLGTQGTFTLFTTKDYSKNKNWRGKQIGVKNGLVINTDVEGPKYKYFNQSKTAKIPLKIEVKDSNTVILNVQDQTFNLKRGDFSDWVKLKFDIDIFNKVNGIGKFYLKSIRPDFELYLSPINFDPEKPLYPISYPANYIKDLEKKFGPFYTQGLPVDTWAYEEGIFDDKAFLKHSQEILDEHEKIFFWELNKFQDGLFVGYFGSVDSIQHMFWRAMQDKNSQYKDTIMSYYRKMDDIVGKTMRKMDKNTTLIILSDHGFGPFDYEVNLNNWLKDNGYMVLRDEAGSSTGMFDQVDWNKTRAYAVGYNGIFINLKGRETQGIVDKKDYKKLTSEIIKKLSDLKNPSSGEKVIKRILTKENLGALTVDIDSPDLFIGFYKGTRSSWEGAVGITGPNVMEPRQSRWSGDHLFDPSEVPGVLFINKKLNIKNPRIIDIIPSILNILNVQYIDMEGANILKNQKNNKITEESSSTERLKSLPY